ncbi:MAG: type II toxin-antitoxin system RelE/ParE family toxin [Ignavibacteriae bacterium]|nr:type II toxin-antitoxin system RelE/ParE family toxin [Ignavibacteriota bacterium]
MGLFRIEFKTSIEHDLNNIDKQYIPKILSIINELTIKPFPVGYKKLKDSESLYRIRFGNYRIIYKVDIKTKTIYIYHIRHRKDVYRKQ